VTARELTVEEIMAILPSTPGRLASMTDALTRDELHVAPEPGSWSVNDVLAHLRACSDVLGGNAIRIVTEDHPAWRGMSPRTWQARTDYHDWEFGPAFDAFARQRAELLAILEPLAPAAWERTATVTVPPKKVIEYSARYYADWLASHERAHVRGLPRIIEAVVERS
jgi:hypothetical protein